MTKRGDKNTLPDCSSGELPIDHLQYQLTPRLALTSARQTSIERLFPPLGRWPYLHRATKTGFELLMLG